MPWCHECEAEYENGTEACPECGALLCDEMPPSRMKPAKAGWSFRRSKSASAEWPKDQNGDNVPSAFLTNVMGTHLDYEMALSVLRAFNIPYACDFPGAGRFAELTLGFSGAGMDIYVPETMLEDAKNVLFGDSEE